MSAPNGYGNDILRNLPRCFLLLPFVSLICSVAYTQPSTDTIIWEKLSFEALRASLDTAKSPEERLPIINAGISKAKAENHALREAEFSYLLASLYGQQGQYQSVRKIGKRPIALAKKEGEHYLALKLYNLYAGYGYYSLQAFEPAIELYTEALQYAGEHRQALGDSLYTRMAIQIFPPLSESYFRTGQYSLHLETIKAYQKLAIASESPLAMAAAAITVGASAIKFNNYARAKQVLLEGYAFIKDTDYTTLKFNFFINLFDIYMKEGQLDSALLYAQLHHDLAIQRDFPFDRYTSLYRLAEIDILRKDYELALGKLEKCLAFFSIENAPIRIGNIHLLKSKTLSGLGREQEALAEIRLAKAYTDTISDLYFLKELLRQEADLYYQTGATAKAFEALQLYNEASDSLRQQELSKEIESMQVSLQLQAQRLKTQEQQTALLQKENQLLLSEQKSRQLTWILLALFLLFVLLLIGLLLERRRSLRAARSLSEQTNQQLDELLTAMRNHASLLTQELTSHPDTLLLPIRSEDNAPEPEEAPQSSRRKLEQLKSFVNREQELLTKIRNLAQEKEETLKSFNYIVGHDLKIPLRAALNIIALLEEELPGADPEQLRPHFYYLQSSLEQLAKMLDDIIQYAQADRLALQPKPIQPAGIIQAIWKQLEHAVPDLPEDTTLQLPDHLPEVYADPPLFRLVITNLLTNAIKATARTPRPVIRISAQPDGRFLKLLVSDNGMGIALPNQQRLFSLFKSVHNRQEFPGTGAGLAIVKRIMERHEGRIEVESPGEGQGTTVAIIWPIPNL